MSLHGLAALVVALATMIGAVASPAAAAPREGLLEVLRVELETNFQGLKDRGPDPLHYLAYEVRESEHRCVSAQFGAVVRECATADRALTIDLRVGSPELDSTHEIRDRGGAFRSGRTEIPFPLDNARAAAAALLWIETDKAFKKAQERLSQVRANRQVTADEQDGSGDFTLEEPSVSRLPLAPEPESLEGWRERIREYSRLLAAGPQSYESQAKIDVQRENRFFCSSEGAMIEDGALTYRLRLEAATLAADGMGLPLSRNYYARDLAGLPDDAAIKRDIARLLAGLDALRDAPVVEPYVGPAILVNEAAAVFFHEILGHRLEGSELKSEQSGQTFKGKVGSPVTSPIISVFDDPGQKHLGGQPLLGHYGHDSEGQPARRATLVERGVLRGFLMSRTPVAGFKRSNGHGRREPGNAPASRMGNLFVEAAQSVSSERLVQMLQEECRRQGKPWGLLFEDVSGGFTNTGRWAPNAFKVIPRLVYRVSAEDGSRTLVRGVDVIGTPLQAFTKILAAGDDPGVFNGFCGAGSGQVPVSAVAPSLLFSEIEVQKKQPGQERPPILPAPPPAEAKARRE